MKEIRKSAMRFVNLLVFILLTLSATQLRGQAINGVIAESPVEFAGNSDFSAGELTITFNMPAGQTVGELKVNLATGIEYLPGSVTATGATIALKSGSTNANKPEFSLTGASGVVKVTLKRKVTKAVLTNAALASGLFDEAILTIGGVSTNPPAKNAPGYQLPRPTLAVQLPTAQTDVLGARTETFDIRNTGYGKVKDVYFSIAYDHRDVVGGSVSHNGTLLTPVGTVPVGLPNAGKPIYKIPNANLANNGVVTITEKYTVNKCTAGRQNAYYAYWGSGIANSNDIFETSSNTRNISVSTGIPIIRHSDNSAFNYFKWQDGFCGNILGTYYVRFNNETADPKGTAYNVEVKLFDGDPTIGFSFFEPINIRLVATDGTEIPIAATGTGDTRFINFTNLAAVSNASLGTKNVGFTDEDGDGFKDDLKKGAYFQIAFDLKRKQSFQCLQPGKGPKNYFSLQPRAYVLYDNVCRGGRDSSDLRLIDYGTMRVYFNGVNDASKLPAQLVQNVPSAGYIAPGMNWPSLGIHQRTKNTTLADNERQFKYVITTPAGVKLQNVKLYRKTNIFGASPTTPINQPDIEAGTTVTITTTNTPADRDLTSGYLSFDALLQGCNGATAPITYSVYLMVKNGDGTYCDIPLVCNQVTNIPTICSTPCAIQGPRMLSTKVERADNSYGWKDHTMAARQTRTNVSSIERMRALYLDDIEFISEGQQHTGKSATNLFYYAKVENTAKLEPKKITLKVNGGAEQTFTATPNNPMRGTNAAGKNYFRWNLTSLLPAGTLPAGATFTAVATYQVKNNNPTNSNDRTMDIQSGIESFFYTLDNPTTDVTISTEGYHAAEKHCGANLTPIFYIAETQSMLATNEYKEFSGCNIVELGGNLIYAARRFKPGGTYFSQEFRPARLTKKITIKMPSAYRINNIKYTYTYKIAEAAKEATVDMSRLTVVDDGTWKTYTYINPPKGTTGHLPPGMITVVNDYNEYLKVFIQPSCKAKTVDGNKTYWDQGLDAKAMNEKISSNIEYEDYYYHYAETGNSTPAIDVLNDRPILFAESKKPEITIDAISQLTVKANKRVMEATFKLKNIKEYDAPFGWISVPDVTGIEVISLEEGGHTYTAQNSISGEKMFFLSDKGNDGKILKNSERQFKLKYKITNCAAALQLKVYAGWNCNENPTSGYRNTCSDKSITYNIAIAKSKKEIAADPGNPGENDPNKKGSIPMCTATPYTYVINSADEGDIYNAKLVVTQGNGITISNVKVEYPLGGTVYTEGTGAGKILHTQSGNRHTYDISNILPEGSLPGSLNEPNNANKRKFKLTFDVTPDCDFSAGSSFDIDVEGTNLCDSPAAGDKTRAIIAGIQGVNISDYNITLDPLTYVSGNGTLCGGGVIYKTRVMVNSGSSTFQMGSNARLKFTIPEGYELAPSYARYYGRTPYGPGALWANPVRKQTEERTLASGSELVMEIPAGMKDGQFFEFGIHIIQKAAALLDCDNPKQLKVYATDTKTGVMCGGTACPPVTVTTSLKEETVDIKNERPKLSFSHTQVNATAVAKNGKEELTIKYKIKNASGAAALTNTQPLKIDLYKDVNNSGGLDSGDVKLTATPYTLNINLAANGESAEQTIIAEVPQDAVCRLLLAINNQDNVCLCEDVVATLNAPTELTGLVDNLTICESETKQIAYSAAGASYEAYTWSGNTTDDNIAYLSAANVKEPNFHYTGTKLTATKTFTYKLKVKRTNGCEATQEVKITVQPAPSISTQPVVPTTPYCMGGAATPLTVIATSNGVAGTLTYEWYENTTNSYTGATLKNTGQNFTPPTNVAGTKYYFVKVKNSGCGETLSNIVMVKTNATPAQPTVTQDQAAGCGTVSTAKVTNLSSYASGITFKVTKGGTPVSATVASNGSINGISDPGNYVIKAVQDGCESAGTTFTIDAKKPIPVTPVVSQVSAAGCGTLSTAKVSNYATYPTSTTFTITTAADVPVAGASVAADGTINGITSAGTYKVKATQGTCDSSPVNFTINAALAVPVAPVVSQVSAAGCGTLSTAKVSNYATYPSGTIFTITTAADAPVAGASVATDGTINGITSADTYKVKAKIGTCTSEANFTIDAALAVPAAPTVAPVAAAGCGTLSTAKVSNYATYPSGTTFTITTVADAPVAGASVLGDGTISGITSAGTYKVKAKQGTCTSEANFTIDAALAVPAAPTVTTVTECPTLVSTQFDMATLVTPTAGHTLKWYDAATGGTALAVSPKVERQVTAKSVTTKYVSQEKDGCESARVAVTYTVDDTVAPSLTADDIVLDCTAANFDTLVTTWLTTTAATATDACTTPMVTNNYSKPTDLCGAWEIEVTFTAKDSFGNQTQKKAKIRFIVAKDDDYTATPVTPSATEQVVKDGSGTPYNVLSNDKLYGNGATTSNVTISEVAPNANVKIDTTTGQVKVQPNTPAGTYTVTYRICDKNTPTACSNVATVTVKVVPATPTIKANDDPDTNIPRTGGSIDILSNDRLNGGPVTKDNVNITIDNNGGLTTVMIDPTTGKLVVPNNSTPGTYTVTYKICDKANATVCDTAKVKIIIAPGTIHNIEAVDDGVWEVGTQGEFLTPSVLNNDRIGSKTGLNASDVLIERTQGQPAPDSHLVMNDDGRITVRSAIAIGTYIYYYTIIDRANNNQTSSAKAIIKVVSFVAQQDEYSLTNTKDREQNTPSVITNDEMDGKKPPVIGTDVTLTPGTPSHPNLHMNPDGTITIAPNTPDGVYTYDYTICRVSNPTDCKTTQAIINLHPSLVANDDDYSAHPVNVIHQSAVVGNVLDNDTLGGTPITDPTKVTITLIDNDGLSGVSFAPNGEVTVPQGAPAGTYRVRYNLCMSQQASVCDDAIVTIVVAKEDPIVIYNGISSNGDGKNDGFRIEGIENYRKNTLKIFNRWGVLVYQKEGYTNADPFTGYSNGRSTIESGKKLPQGTYYYILEYENSNNQTQTKSGWLYLKRD